MSGTESEPHAPGRGSRPQQPGRIAGPHLILPTGQQWPLTGDVLAIGREIGNHILIDNPLVSSQHAKIVRTDRGYVILDLGSTNGTFVNRERIRDLCVLRDGDQIEVAGERLQFHTGAASASDGGSTPATPGSEVPSGMVKRGMLLFEEVPIIGRELTIGRADQNRLVIDDPLVSQQHAKIVRVYDDYFLLDLRSRNGTFVNKEQVRDLHLLRDGDLIAIGTKTFTFMNRLMQVQGADVGPELTSSFVFADVTGRRWVWVRIVTVIVVLLLSVFAFVFFRFIVQ